MSVSSDGQMRSSFIAGSNAQNDNSPSRAFVGADGRHNNGSQQHTTNIVDTSGVGGTTNMSLLVSQSLGDPKWQAASQKAESTLEAARLHSERFCNLLFI